MNNAISLMRVLSMLYIVFYHSICFYGVWKRFPNLVTYEYIDLWREASYVALYSFVFISGYLFGYLYINKCKYRDRSVFLKSKFNRLLWPYIFWALLVVFLFPSQQPLLEFLSGIQHLWFLLMLFGIFATCIFLIKQFLRLKLKYQIGGVILTILTFSLASKVHNYVPNVLGWFWVFKYLPVFTIGVIFAQRRWISVIKGIKSIYLISTIILAISFILIFKMIGDIPLGALYRDIPKYAFVVLIFALLSKKNIRTNVVTTSLDKCSLGIYIIHHILIWAFLYYCPNGQFLTNNHEIVAPIMMFIIVLLMSWGITTILLRSKILSKLIGA